MPPRKKGLKGYLPPLLFFFGKASFCSFLISVINHR